MAQQTINIGAAPDDGTGDTIRVGGDKINDNFTELYAADAALGTAAALDIDIDDTLAANSDSLIPTQQAVKAYVDAVAGGGSVDVQDETTPVLTASTLNFTGAGVVATDAGGGVATITIAGGGGGVDVEEEGGAVATASVLNFVGSAVTATDAGGGQVDVTITGGAGALVFLGEQVASASASLDFTGFISATYEQYVFEIIDILPASDNVNLLMRMSTDGGSSYAAGASDYAYAYNQAAAGFTSGVGSNGTTSIGLTGAVDTVTATENRINGSVKLFGPAGARHKNVTFQTSGLANDNNFYNFVGSGRYKSTTAVDAIRFIASSGNITSGAIRVYGITKA